MSLVDTALTPPVRKSPLRTPGFWIRLGFSLALLGWVFSRIDWAGAMAGLASAQPAWFLLAAALLMLSSVLAGLRWAILMKRAGFRATRMPRWLSLYFASSLINQGLPTVMGGDSFRAWQAARPHKKAALVTSPNAPGFRLAVGTVVLDRTLGLTGNLLLGCIGLLWLGSGWLDLPDGLNPDTDSTLRAVLLGPHTTLIGEALLALIASGLILFALLLAWPGLAERAEPLLARFNLKGLLPATRLAYGFQWLLPQLVVAIAIHALGVAAMAACLYGVGVTPPLSALMVTLPALGILLLLPISISGWGLRESALSAVLTLWGVPAGLTVLASVAFGLMTLLATLPGLPALITPHTKTEHARTAP